FSSEIVGIKKDPLGLPRLYPLELFRESPGLSGKGKRLSGQDCRCRVMSVRDPGDGVKSSYNDVGLKTTDSPNHIRQYLLFVPVLKCLAWIFAIAEIHGSGEKLFPAISFAGFDQFLGPDLSELYAELLSDQILST